MAGPAPPSTMDSVIAATVEDMRNVLKLPAGWHASFSFRLNAESASVLVSFSKTEKLVTREPLKKKMKKRSPSSRKRSAARGREHRDRTQLPIVPPQQQPTLNPLSPPFVPYSASEPGQPVAGSVQDSGRKRPTVTRDSPDSNSDTKIATYSSAVSGLLLPPPPPSCGYLETEGGRVAAGTTSNKEVPVAAIQSLLERWEGGNQAEIQAAAQVLDSLAQCPGFANQCLGNYLTMLRNQSGRPL